MSKDRSIVFAFNPIKSHILFYFNLLSLFSSIYTAIHLLDILGRLAKRLFVQEGIEGRIIVEV